MTRFVFRIGDAFPAGDEVARFVVTLAMMSNDALRSFKQLSLDEGNAEQKGEQMMLFRQQAALYYEAASFIADSAHHYPALAEFLGELPQEARDEHAQLVGGIDRASPHYVGDWLSAHRHVTFHYAAMHPEKAARGKEKLQQALEAAADLEGELTHGKILGSFRCGFADEVASQWMPDEETIVKLRDALLALAPFTQRALTAYQAKLPPGTFRDG